MEQRSIKTLKLMEAIQERPKQSQRQLAGALNLSLGLVNKLINELSSQGILETDNCGKSKVQYALTPKGAVWQTDLKRQYLKHQIDTYIEIKKVVGQGLKKLKGLPQNGRILFYGAGALCEIACLLSSKSKTSYDIKVIDDLKAGNSINGYRIYKEAEIENMAYDGIFIMKLDKNNRIRDKLVAKGLPSNKIFGFSL